MIALVIGNLMFFNKRDEVLRALARSEEGDETLRVPGPIAIAHHLLKTWANQDY